MKKQSTTILYLFIILIILSGIVLFIFKDKVANKLISYDVVPKAAVRVNDDFKLDILRDNRIKELKNYISIFDYNDLQKSQELILKNYNSGLGADVEISNPDDEAAVDDKKNNLKPQRIIRVKVGNSNPFLVKKAVK